MTKVTNLCMHRGGLGACSTRFGRELLPLGLGCGYIEAGWGKQSLLSVLCIKCTILYFNTSRSRGWLFRQCPLLVNCSGSVYHGVSAYQPGRGGNFKPDLIELIAEQLSSFLLTQFLFNSQQLTIQYHNCAVFGWCCCWRLGWLCRHLWWW